MASQYFYQDDLNIKMKTLAEVLGITVQGLTQYLAKNSIGHTKGKGTILRPSLVREIILHRGLSYPKLVVNVHNSKGGVGKTTLTHALALRAVQLGFKVLAIDLDQQANLTKSFGHRQRAGSAPTIEHVLFEEFDKNPCSPADAIIARHQFLDLIPADMSLANIDTVATTQAQFGVPELFRSVIEKMKYNYDLIIFDSPPANNSITLSATYNSDRLLIPTDPDDDAIDGIAQVLMQLNIAQKKHSKCQPSIVFTKVQQNITGDIEKFSEVLSRYPEFTMKTLIPFTTKFKESRSKYKNIWLWKGKANIAQSSLEAVCDETLCVSAMWAAKSLKEKYYGEADA